MPIKADSVKTTDPIPAGAHAAVCYGVVAVGTQESQEFGNKRKVVILWELPNETKEYEGKLERRTISRRYTLSLNKKATLRKDLECWRGKAFTDEETGTFEIDRLIGANCLLNIVQESKEGKTYSNVTAVMPLTKGMPKETAQAGRLYFNLDEAVEAALVEGKSDVSFPEGLPEWIVNTCKASSEYKGFVGGGGKKPQADAPQAAAQTAPAGDDKEVPF